MRKTTVKYEIKRWTILNTKRETSDLDRKLKLIQNPPERQLFRNCFSGGFWRCFRFWSGSDVVLFLFIMFSGVVNFFLDLVLGVFTHLSPFTWHFYYLAPWVISLYMCSMVSYLQQSVRELTFSIFTIYLWWGDKKIDPIFGNNMTIPSYKIYRPQWHHIIQVWKWGLAGVPLLPLQARDSSFEVGSLDLGIVPWPDMTWPKKFVQMHKIDEGVL